MNRGLLATLGATVALSAWALLRPASAPVVGTTTTASLPGPAPRDEPLTLPSSTSSTGLARTMSSPQINPSDWPVHWPRPEVDTSLRSPFVPPQPPAPKQVAPPPPPVVQTPLPPLPVADYRFWGRFAGPDGKRLVYVSRGNVGTAVPIEVGSKLEDGWQVQAIGENSIALVHTATQQRAVVPIPVEAPSVPK